MPKKDPISHISDLEWSRDACRTPRDFVEPRRRMHKDRVRGMRPLYAALPTPWCAKPRPLTFLLAAAAAEPLEKVTDNFVQKKQLHQ